MKGDLAERDASCSLNFIPDIPRKAHRCYKITRDFQLLGMHPRHTVDTK